jgi:fibronectin type 3 domain-containing protein
MRYIKLALTALLVLASGIVQAAPSSDTPGSEALTVDAISWGFGNMQWGKQLFWDHGDTSLLVNSRASADKSLSQGVSPLISAVNWPGANRWGDTTDTVTGFQHADKAWVAYTYWEYAHDSLTPVLNTGSYISVLGSPNGIKWTAAPGTSNDVGWIAPAEPLGVADCPDGRTTCTWGDWAAEKVARLCAADHDVGVATADYVEGFPNTFANQIDFNPRVIAAFGDSIGITIPGATVAAQATYITTNLMSKWLDYHDKSYAHFYSEIARKVQLYSGRIPLNQAQIAWDVATGRWLGKDLRLFYAARPNPANWFFMAEMQGDNDRPMQSVGFETGIFGTLAAWEPSFPLGAKMNIVDSYDTLSLNSAGIPLTDTGSIYDRNWLNISFIHVANRNGTLRRGVQAFQYGYNDLQQLGHAAVTTAIDKYIPRRAYGPAFFYSDTMIKKHESQGSIFGLEAESDTAWMHAPHGYYVTEVALDSLKPTAIPTCWIVTEPNLLVASERAKLTKYAPVVGTPDSAYNYYSPIKGSGASGNCKAWGFVAQDSSLVVVATNTAKGTQTYSISVAGLPAGPDTLYDGVTNSLLAVIQDSGKATRTITATFAEYDSKLLVLKSAFAHGTAVVVTPPPVNPPSTGTLTVTGLTATTNPGQAVLNWSALVDTIKYNVYASSAGHADSLVLTTPNLTGTISGLANGTQYTFHVTATNTLGSYQTSATTSVTPLPPLPAQVSVPTAVAGNAQVIVSWSASANASSYLVYQNHGTGDSLATTTSATSVTLVGLANGTTYTYHVTATNIAGSAATSATVSATPVSPLPAQVGYPTGIAGNAQVILSWTGVTGATYYNVYQNHGTGDSLAATTTAPTTTYTFTGLINGTMYTYHVSAGNAAGIGMTSGTFSIFPVLPIPAAAVVTDTTTSSATLTWGAVSAATAYQVYETVNGGAKVLLATVSTTSYTATLVRGSSYVFTVVATNSSGAGPSSASVTATAATP